jgi:hypothetical protein
MCRNLKILTAKKNRFKKDQTFATELSLICLGLVHGLANVRYNCSCHNRRQTCNDGFNTAGMGIMIYMDKSQ